MSSRFSRSSRSSRSSKSKAKVNNKTYTKKSNIPNIGNGLFAKTKINKGTIIEEYKGRLRKPNERTTSNRSNIYFNDEHILECYDDDLASYANDLVELPKQRRKLMETLRSDKPFYTKHQNTKINAEIKINDRLHRAFLMAAEDINIGDEIFCHYGFTYWFKKEISTVGFDEEEEIEENGFPDKIFEYPSFMQYVTEMYPGYRDYEVYPYDDGYDFVIHFDDDTKLLMHIENFATKISRVPTNLMKHDAMQGLV